MTELQRFLVNGCKALLSLTMVNGDRVDTSLTDELLAPSYPQSMPNAFLYKDTSPPKSPQDASCKSPPQSIAEEETHKFNFTSDPLSNSDANSNEQLAVATAKRKDPLLSSPEYPNGDVHYSVPLSESCSSREARGVGWAMLIYGGNRSNRRVTHLKSCLGLYQCPRRGCEFSERPRIPRRHKAKGALPLPSKSICITHHEVLVHLPCSATMKTVQYGSTVDLYHTGLHNHPRPHPIRPDLATMHSFENTVRIAPEVRPKSLQIGTATRPPLSSLHRSFGNLGHLTYQRSKILAKASQRSAIGNVANFETNVGEKLIVSSSIDGTNGHICMQTVFMRERLQERESSLQTDSIEGFLVDEHCTAVNVAITSGHCSVVNRTIPLLISILMGKSALHYASHFAALFQTMSMSHDLSEWESTFPGNTCDFSDAERAGFEMALRTHCKVSADVDVVLERYYRCCSVHFKRTLTRVRRNGALVPPGKESAFYTSVCGLLKIDSGPAFVSQVHDLIREYPKIKKWLTWHVVRGQHIFPAMAKADLSLLSDNTNAQECLGGDFQRCAPKKKLSIAECMDHSYRYVKQIQMDYALAKEGVALRYKKPAKKSKYVNDGRPPDKNSDFASNPRIGRPKGSRNLVPKVGDDLHMESFGIPWSFKYGDFAATNTCAMDTALMLIFFMNKYSGLTQAGDDPVLKEVLSLLAAECYDRARFVWCTKTLMMEPTGCHDMWGSIDDVFVDKSPNLFKFTTTSASMCGSDFCLKAPRFSKNCERTHISLNLSAMTRNLDQQALEAFFEASESPCDVTAVSQDIAGAPDDAFRRLIQVEIDADGNCTDVYRWACRGLRREDAKQMLTYPAILDIPVVVTESPMVAKPAETITIGEWQYDLAAIIYTNSSGNHFFGHVFIHGRPLLYDGLLDRKLRWQTIPAYRQSKYAIARIWYLKKRLQPVPLTTSTALTMMDSECDDDDLDVKASILKFADAHGSDNVLNKQSRMPMGLSIQVVSAKGPRPVCVGCNQAMERGDRRLYKRQRTNLAKGWTAGLSYHLRGECMPLLSAEEKDELKRLIDHKQTLHNFG